MAKDNIRIIAVFPVIVWTSMWEYLIEIRNDLDETLGASFIVNVWMGDPPRLLLSTVRTMADEIAGGDNLLIGYFKPGASRPVITATIETLTCFCLSRLWR